MLTPSRRHAPPQITVAATTGAPAASPPSIGRMITAGDLRRRHAAADGARRCSRRLGVSPDHRSARRGAASPPSGRSRPAAATARSSAHPIGPGGPRRYRRVTRGPGPLRARPVVGHARPGAAARPRPDRGPGQPAVAHVELPRPPGAARRSTRSCDDVVAVPGRGDHRGRRRDGRPRPRRPGASLRLGDRVVVEHPTFPPLLDLLEQLGCEVDRRRRRRRRACGSTGCAPRSTTRGARRRCSSSRAPTTRPGWRMSQRAGRGARRAAGGLDAIVVEDDHANDIAPRRS